MKALAWGRRWAVALLGMSVLAGLRLALLRGRYFDTDELEHLHAAYCLAHGNTLYRQFFENHGPLFYLLLLPIARAATSPAAAIWAGRALMTAFWLLLLALQWRIPSDDAGPGERACAVLLLASFSTFALKSLEIRPDVPAAALLSALLLLGRRKALGNLRPLLLGVGIGLGLLVSLKLVYAAAGLLAAAVVAAWRKDGWRAAARLGGGLAFGAVMPVAVCAAAFWRLDALGAFLRCYGLFNLRFQRGFSPQTFLFGSILENPVVWIAGCLGLARGLNDPFAAATLIASLLGLLVVPSTYPQYYVFVGPLLSCSAARTLWRLDWRWAAPAGALSVCVGAAVQARALRQDNVLQLERLSCVSRATSPDERIIDVWSGESFHRPHASYYWYLPEDVQAALGPRLVEASLLAALADPRARGLIWAQGAFARLPSPVVDYARAHFRPAGCGRLFLRESAAGS